MGKCKICGQNAEVGLTLVSEKDVVKHYGEFCDKCATELNREISNLINFANDEKIGDYDTIEDYLTSC